MHEHVLTLPLRDDGEVVMARRRTRELAALLELPVEDQSRLATAVSQIAEAAATQAEHATVEFALIVEPRRRALIVTVRGLAHATLTGIGDRRRGSRGLDLDALGTLVDRVEMRDDAGSAAVRLTRELPYDAWLPSPGELGRALAGAGSDIRDEAVDELRRQNAELALALASLRERERELLALNRRLQDTNRAVEALYDEVDEQAAALRERSDILKRLVSTISHEVRTPLYAVQGITEALRSPSSEPMTPRQHEDVEVIDAAIAEALEIVNDQLDLARLQAGRAVLRLSTVSVPELFSALRGMLESYSRNPGVELVFAIVEDLPDLHTDRAKLSQILRNYISNALKFTQSGEVRVAAALTEDGRAVEFTVSDTGPGLTEDEQELVFLEYGQAAATGPDNIASTGLGLPISKWLADLLGGRVGVLSEPGEGAAFFVVVPLEFTTQDPAVVVKDERPV